MEVKINNNGEMLDATIEMVDGVMVVSPKEVKFEPKDGDILFVKSSCDNIIIYKEDVSYVGRYVNFRNYGNLYTGNDVVCSKDLVKEIRYATEEEKKKLFDKLAEEGWEWKADTKELVKLKWRPKLGETYFSISGSTRELCVFRPFEYEWCNDSTDNKLYELGRCFMTEEECHEFCNRLNDAVNSVKP